MHSVGAQGDQPLFIAASSWDPRLERLEVLIDNAADIDYQGFDGNTALLNAMAAFNLEETALLFRRGANVHILNKFGQGVLHSAARYSGMKTFETPCGFGKLLGCLDADARDANGKTPRGLFNARSPQPKPELREAFERFVGEVEGTLEEDVKVPLEEVEGKEVEEEEFVDAVEVQNV